ncbi:MAG: glycosyltransferase family 4 protein [Capsulimonadaceae bacterium]|nr:glycosyltransferase family 4 protein [Capsulimonadaceae bacterium]
MKLAFALEYSLGHATHADNLKAAIASMEGIEARYLDLPYHGTPLPLPWSAIGPLRDNWSVRASLAASRGMCGWTDCDAAFFHTQVTALFSGAYMRRVPSVVSLDATPYQIDDLAAGYGHPVHSGAVEALKHRIHCNAFAAARGLVAWSEWAKRSLVKDYAVDANRVAVIPPGIDVDRWKIERSENASGVVRVLFVGGDFERKGGAVLLDAFRRARRVQPDIELDIVTRSEDVGAGQDEGVRVHNGLTPNCPALVDLYARADLFAFPTTADCLPLAIMEALAAGLPVLTTDVAAIPEAVEHEQTGLIVNKCRLEDFGDALIRLAGDEQMRRAMSARARVVARERFNASRNYGQLVDLLRRVAEGDWP